MIEVDYLKELNIKTSEQEIVGNLFDIELSSNKPFCASEEIAVELRIRDFKSDYGQTYKPVLVPFDSNFNTQKWSKKFGKNGFIHAATLPLKEVQSLLEHCTRLANLSAYW